MISIDFILAAAAATTAATTAPAAGAGGASGAEAHSHAVMFLRDLAIVMIVAGLVTVLFHRLRQPVVLGYILAGVIVGPFTPPFPLVKDVETIRTLSELGVIFLMFSLGMHFNLRKLAAVGGTAFIAAALEIVLMVWLGYRIGRAFDWNAMDSLFLGAILSISSTTIIVKALQELKLTKERFSELIFGILIVEDMLAIAMIALLSGYALNQSLAVKDVMETVGRLLIFLVTTLVVGLIVVPRLLRFVARFGSNEMLLVATLGLVFGVSLVAVMMEYSVALGAFLIGAIIAEAREAGKIDTLIEPVRDMFSAIFFVAIGMLIEPRLLGEYALAIAVITAAVVIGKLATNGFGAFITGNGLRTSTRVGMGLAQIGEFSFIIATLGLTLNVTSDFLYPIAVTVSAITTLLTPYLIRASDPMVDLLTRRVLPAKVTSAAETYTSWARSITTRQREANQIRTLMRKWAVQIGLNIALMTAIFLVAAAVGQMELLSDAFPGWSGASDAMLWLGAMLLALPLVVATARKLRAVAVVMGELSIARGTGSGPQLHAKRSAIGGIVTVVFYVLLFVWLLVLSSAIMPPWPIFVGLVAIVALITVLRWQDLIKMYARAQIALRETVTAPPATVNEQTQAPRPMPGLLRDAMLETIEIGAGSMAAGKLIRELQLRSRTGASAVGIEREGASVINPGPDEELRTADKVLLLGTEPQLAAARQLLATP